MKTSDLSRACLQAYVDKDRSAVEALIATDFHFSSPIDNLLDRATYFARCWPNSESMRAATVVAAADEGNQAFVVYEAETGTKRFRNCEMHTSRDGSSCPWRCTSDGTSLIRGLQAISSNRPRRPRLGHTAVARLTKK